MHRVPIELRRDNRQTSDDAGVVSNRLLSLRHVARVETVTPHMGLHSPKRLSPPLSLVTLLLVLLPRMMLRQQMRVRSPLETKGACV